MRVLENVPAHQYHPCHHLTYPEQRHMDLILSPQLIVYPISGQGHAVHPQREDSGIRGQGWNLQ
eukprot:15365234-Ditylum_brightwellii.AAC.2